MKICNQCHLEKDRECFSPDKRNQNGLSNTCTECEANPRKPKYKNLPKCRN